MSSSFHLGRGVIILLGNLVFTLACGEAPPESTVATPVYDRGKLQSIAYDLNKNGIFDAWMIMEGARPVQVYIDKTENGLIERWELYDQETRLERIGLSYQDDGHCDVWVYPGPDGQTLRKEISRNRNDRTDRWEWYEAGQLVRAEEDSDGDRRVDKWDTYNGGRIATTSFDENRDETPDRRLTYDTRGALVSIESEPDQAGVFTKRMVIRPENGDSK